MAITALCMARPVFCQTADTDLTHFVSVGMKIRISDDRRQVSKGRVETVSSAAVSLRSKDGLSEFLLKDIAKIEREDGLKNGALIGLVAGAVAGMINGATDEQGRGHRRRFFFSAAAIGATVWTIVGTVIDAWHRKVIYRRDFRPGTPR
jgi:hypothetical protein